MRYYNRWEHGHYEGKFVWFLSIFVNVLRFVHDRQMPERGITSKIGEWWGCKITRGLELDKILTFHDAPTRGIGCEPPEELLTQLNYVETSKTHCKAVKIWYSVKLFDENRIFGWLHLKAECRCDKICICTCIWCACHNCLLGIFFSKLQICWAAIDKKSLHFHAHNSFDHKIMVLCNDCHVDRYLCEECMWWFLTIPCWIDNRCSIWSQFQMQGSDFLRKHFPDPYWVCTSVTKMPQAKNDLLCGE